MEGTVSLESYRRVLRKVERQRKELAYLNEVGGNRAVRAMQEEVERLRDENLKLHKESYGKYLECLMYREMLGDAAEDYRRLVSTIGAYVADSLSDDTGAGE